MHASCSGHITEAQCSSGRHPSTTHRIILHWGSGMSGCQTPPGLNKELTGQPLHTGPSAGFGRCKEHADRRAAQDYGCVGALYSSLEAIPEKSAGKSPCPRGQRDGCPRDKALFTSVSDAPAQIPSHRCGTCVSFLHGIHDGKSLTLLFTAARERGRQRAPWGL